MLFSVPRPKSINLAQYYSSTDKVRKARKITNFNYSLIFLCYGCNLNPVGLNVHRPASTSV